MITEKLMEKPWMFWRVWKAFSDNGFSVGGSTSGSTSYSTSIPFTLSYSLMDVHVVTDDITLTPDITNAVSGAVTLVRLVADGTSTITISGAAEVTGNIVGLDFKDNTIGLRFQNNTLAQYFGYDIDEGSIFGNIVGNDFKDNITLGSAYGNVIGNRCIGNTWGSTFKENHLANSILGNVCGLNFSNNSISTTFQGNTIGDDFINWDIKYNCFSKDFTLITYPTNANKYILYDATALLSWGYWDNGTFILTAF